MAAIVGKRVRNSQPQQNPLIDWSNPITAGLVFAYTMGNEAQGWGEDGRNGIPYVRSSDGALYGRAVNTLAGTGGQLLSTSSGYLFAPSNQTSIKTGVYSLFAFGTGPSSGIQSALDDDDGTNRRFQFRLNAGKAELIPFYSGGNGSVVSPVALSASDLATGFAMGATVNSTAYAIYQKGIKTAGAALASTALTPNASISIGARKTGNTQNWLVGGLMLVAIWNRPLTDAEHLSLADNPWQLFKPAPRRLWLAYSAAPATLDLGGAFGTSSSTSVAALSAGVQIAAAGANTSATSAALNAAIKLAGAGTIPSMAGAALTATINLAAGATSPSTSGATLTTTVRIGAAGATPSTSGASLSTGSAWSASSSSTSGVSAVLSTAIKLSAGGASASSAATNLSALGSAWSASSATLCSSGVTLSTAVQIAAQAISAAQAGAVASMAITCAVGSTSRSNAGATLSTAAGAWIASSMNPCGASAALATSIQIAAWARMPSASTCALTTSIRVACMATTRASSAVDLASARPLVPNPNRTYLARSRIRAYIGQKRVRTL